MGLILLLILATTYHAEAYEDLDYYEAQRKAASRTSGLIITTFCLYTNPACKTIREQYKILAKYERPNKVRFFYVDVELYPGIQEKLVNLPFTIVTYHGRVGGAWYGVQLDEVIESSLKRMLKIMELE